MLNCATVHVNLSKDFIGPHALVTSETRTQAFLRIRWVRQKLEEANWCSGRGSFFGGGREGVRKALFIALTIFVIKCQFLTRNTGADTSVRTFTLLLYDVSEVLSYVSWPVL